MSSYYRNRQSGECIKVDDPAHAKSLDDDFIMGRSPWHQISLSKWKQWKREQKEPFRTSPFDLQVSGPDAVKIDQIVARAVAFSQGSAPAIDLAMDITAVHASTPLRLDALTLTAKRLGLRIVGQEGDCRVLVVGT